MVSLEVIPLTVVALSNPVFLGSFLTLPFMSRRCVCVCVCVCACVYVYVRVCVCVHVRMYVCGGGGGGCVWLCFFIITGVDHVPPNFHHFDDVLNLHIHS